MRSILKKPSVCVTMNIILSATILVILYSCYSFCDEKTLNNPKKWDYLTYNQNWLPAVCNNPEKQKCDIPSNLTIWTIHGLWPDVLTTNLNVDPFFCNNSWHFNVSEIQPIIEDLNSKWPSDEENYPDFWKHEWEKHGTCAASLPQLNSIEKYFAKGLQLHDQFDLTEVLSKGGFIPDPTIEIKKTDIDDLLLKQFGKNILLQCTFIKDSAPLLSAIEICFDKSLTIMDCPKDKTSNCDKDTVVYLPFPETDNDKIEL